MKSYHILVAVSGGIAAYKACDLVSKLSRSYDVKVMMTSNAMEFVRPVTFAALSHNDVFCSEFHSSDPIPHIELAKWADLLIAAPASANLIAKAVHGIADNLVTSTFLACTCPKILCPAMNEHMLENPVTQHNIQLARQYGWIIADPAVGHLACMDTGKGRLPDTPVLLELIRQTLQETAKKDSPDGAAADTEEKKQIPENDPDLEVHLRHEMHARDLFAVSAQPDAPAVRQALDLLKERMDKQGDETLISVPNQDHENPLLLTPEMEAEQTQENSAEGQQEDEIICEDLYARTRPLVGLHVLISAGPTQEALDPVRYITNHSSGKQGYAIAQDAKEWGADVILISGPVSIPVPEGIQVIQITSALEMEKAMQEHASWADFIIMAAAVGDYRPSHPAAQKIKKSDTTMLVEFVKNPDILKSLGRAKKDTQVLCGFAMETENLDANARSKLESKNCDMLIANNLSTAGAGFQNDTNVVSLLKPDSIEHLPLQSKKQLGYTILAQMLEIWKGKHV